MNEIQENLTNVKEKSGKQNHEALFSRNRLPPFIRRYFNLISPLDDIPIWRAFFGGNKLPPVYRPHLLLISNIKMGLGLPWKTSKDSMQLELTSFCNLSCPNCERSIGLAPCKEYMSLEQIDKFINESIDLNLKWKALHLIGGEPTLHPQFFNVLDIIKRYKDINPNCFIVVWTNGYGERVNKILSRLPPWIKIENSKKDPKIVPNFMSYNIAPIDLKEYKNANFSKGCCVTEICGTSLTRYGYYPCGPGATVDRVFGFDVGIKKISDLKDIELKNQMSLLCRYCGYFKYSEDFMKKNLVSEQKTSASWIKAYENYKTKKPELSLY